MLPFLISAIVFSIAIQFYSKEDNLFLLFYFSFSSEIISSLKSVVFNIAIFAIFKKHNYL